jgi:hypothetical protein
MFWKSAIIVASLVAGAPEVSAQVPVPNVPANLTVPEGFTPFLLGHATGTQNYMCLPATKGFAWTLFGPQATLFDSGGAQLSTHFLSANPIEGGTLRATWQDSQDTSLAWAMAIANSTDPAYVAPGAVPWLLLRVVGAELGPNLGARLFDAKYVHRVNTVGGVAPAAGCGHKKDIGARVFVPYTTDYIFYK